MNESDNKKSLFKKELQTLKKWKQEALSFWDELDEIGNMVVFGEIVGGIAHELNQPLNGIRIICQSVLKDIEKNRLSKEDLGPDMGEVIKNVDQMAEKIDHMRRYIRRTGIKNSEMVNFNRIITSVFNVIGQQLRNHNIEVKMALQPDMPSVNVNSVDMEIVFLAIIVYARKALQYWKNEKKIIEIKNHSADKEQQIVTEIAINSHCVKTVNNDMMSGPYFLEKEISLPTILLLSAANKIMESYNGKINIKNKEDGTIVFLVIIPY